MSKRLTLVLLAAAVVAFIATPAFAAVQNVKVSGDLEIVPLARDCWDLVTQSQTATDNQERAILGFLRLGINADLTDNVSVTARLLNEREWDTDATDAEDIQLDLAYVTLKEFLYSPLTLTLGRQELHMGSEMIVGDPDDNNSAVTTTVATTQPDLSKQKAFDAMRATLDYSPLIVDLLYAKIAETTAGAADDQTLYGISANYDLGDDWSSILEAYFYDRIKDTEVSAEIRNGEATQVFGARVVTHPIENLTYSLEGAYQLGTYINDVAVDRDDRTVDREAVAIETAATYAWPEVRYSPTLTALYAYFSGNDDGWDPVNAEHPSYHAWDPLYENQTFGDIACALLDQTNIHLAGLVATAELADDINVELGGYLYWWAEAYGFDSTLTATNHETLPQSVDLTDKSFVGQEIDLSLLYDYTEDVQFGLKLGAFIPGNAFDSSTNSTASQAVGSMKVSF
ncbi:MAG: alginate export family protein [Candidatus Omnitrophica bacterium]|nr:alginate export family protein [Candidatus Omnitrophota bacterium]